MDEGVPGPAPPPQARVGQPARQDGIARSPSTEAMPPPPPPAADLDDLVETRSTRSASSASRHTNRLSLTLPIAPPTAGPSRPTPTSSTMTSFPPTPIDTSSLASPTDPADFITAVAAQERRVLELREDLNRAEHELGKLKRQWSQHENYKKRAEIRRTEPLRPLVPPSETQDGPDEAATRHSVEVDRRKAMLLGQQSAQGTPTQSRRRVFRGGHARTLSLLSPSKTTDAFSVHEDQTADVTSPSKELDLHFQQVFGRYSPATPGQLSKRASWTPRSAHQVSGLRQVADDFKTGLWTFVEDLRQATVGDEPITGAGLPMRGINANPRGAHATNSDEQDTIRPSAPNLRPHVARAFEETPTPTPRFTDALGQETSGSPSSNHRRAPSRTDSRATKHFSWTPLTVDSYDDHDWSNWDSPTVKSSSPRWSGTTVNGDIISTIPEKSGELGTPLKKELSAEPSSALSPSLAKLDELPWPTALKSLSPGNIKRTASDFMKEWEKSLSPPPGLAAAEGGAN